MSPRPRLSCSASAARRRLRVERLEQRMCLAAVPAFSSLPGADHTIYLDFDGHTTQGTTWNSAYNVSTIVSPAYDIDGDTSTFNATELQRIEASWKWVAEDFAPFEVNVTTVDPGPSALSYSGGGDTQWGTRVVITDDTFAGCGCGGHAYLGSFDDSQDEPVFVYNTSLKGVSEASSHEVGHALLLRHDGDSGGPYYWGHGSGATSWAPLMGASYNRNVTQWSKGEYFESNESEDDLAIISALNNGNGFGYKADDHGDSNGAASVLSSAGGTINANGIIEQTSDVDVLSFSTGAGSVSIDIDPAAVGPNLDIKADLYDSSNSLIATSDSSSVLDAGFNLTLAAGQYYIHIDGTGTGSPFSSTPTGYTEYGSLGQWSVSGTVVDPGSLPSLSIDDVTVDEGSGSATFTVTLSGAVTDPVSVDYATDDGSATSGSDYTTTANTLNFAAAGSQTITVPITDDGDTEGTESFVLDLSNASNAAISDGQAVGTINDNDTDISIGDASENEGNLSKGKNKGNPTYKDFTFTVSLSNPVGHTVTVNYSTQDDTATTADNDYQSVTNVQVTFNPGETTQSATVTVVGDGTQEPDETFNVVVSGANGGNIADGTGVGTIRDDDTKSGGGGGGNGGGGGGCNGNGNKPGCGAQEIEMQDPTWWFEGPGYLDSHDHSHDHIYSEERGLPHDSHSGGLIVLGSQVAPIDDSSRSDTWFDRLGEEDDSDEFFGSVDHALNDMDFNGASEQRFISKLADHRNAASENTSSDEIPGDLNDAILSEMQEYLHELLKRYL